MFDYVLKSAATGPVTIEISDESGRPVRHFFSSDKPDPVNEKELNIPMYWIRPARVVSTQAGMHRFVWDLHYPPPDSLEHEYPISAIYHDTPRTPLGPAALPGKYTVKLTVSGISYTQPLTIKMDPRVKATEDGLRQQFELEIKINEAMHHDYQTLQQVRGLRQQLKNLTTKIREGQLKKTVAAVESKTAELEGSEGGYGTSFLSTPEGRSLARLNVGLNTLLTAVDSAEAAPTTQAVSMFNDLTNALDQQLARWDVIKSKDVPELNRKLKRSGLPQLNPELVAATDDLSGNHNRAGDDEP
jgi:hypothetical protein